MKGSRLARFLNTRSLSTRLYLIIIPTAITAISLLAFLDSHVSARMMDAQVENSTAQIASQLAADLSQHDQLSDLETLRKLAGELVETNFYITRIDIYRLNENKLERVLTTSAFSTEPITVDEMASIRESQPLVRRLYQDRERFVKAIAPTGALNGSNGCVTVTATLRQSDVLGEVHYRIALFLIPGSILILVLMLHYLFTRAITRRIDRLAAAMNRAKAGKLSERVSVRHQDELGIITQGFNDLMAEVERASRQRDLLLEEQKSFNAQLQDKVTDATRELSSTNEQLRRVNQDLIETQRRLTQAERTTLAGQMAATFAHEIGSPLSAMSTHLQLLSEDRDITESMRRRLQLVLEQVNRITGFVEELLTETRAATQTRAPVQLNTLLKQLLLFLEQHLARLNVRVQTDFDSDLPDLEANAQQLQQVFLNLLNNASDALPQGGTIRVTTCRQSAAAEGEVLSVSIEDNGIGIPPEKQERIFEPFFSTKDLRRGTGLGLSIAAKIVRQHGGTIELTSAPGKGSRFTIRFSVPAVSGVGVEKVLADS